MQPISCMKYQFRSIEDETCHIVYRGIAFLCEWVLITVGFPCDIKGVPTNDQKKLRGWCKYEVSWGSMCHNLGMCFTEIITVPTRTLA